MNNEPVAWMNSLVKWDIAVEQDITHDIPLYTHPAKTLTDEEIAHIALQDPFWWNPENIKCDIDWLGFARAILKKASEK